MQITMITPAQHKAQAQLIVYSFCKLQGLKTDRNSIFSVGVGNKEPSHWMHSMEVDKKFIDALVIEQKRASTGCLWICPDLTSDAAIMRDKFSLTLESPKEVLKKLKLNIR